MALEMLRKKAISCFERPFLLQTSVAEARTRLSDRSEHLVPVLGMKRADLDRATIAKMFDGRMRGDTRHECLSLLCSGMRCEREQYFPFAFDLDQARA